MEKSSISNTFLVRAKDASRCSKVIYVVSDFEVKYLDIRGLSVQAYELRKAGEAGKGKLVVLFGGGIGGEAVQNFIRKVTTLIPHIENVLDNGTAIDFLLTSD